MIGFIVATGLDWKSCNRKSSIYNFGRKNAQREHNMGTLIPDLFGATEHYCV